MNENDKFLYWKEKYGDRSKDFIEGVIAGLQYCSVWDDKIGNYIIQRVSIITAIDGLFATVVNETELKYEIKKVINQIGDEREHYDM